MRGYAPDVNVANVLNAWHLGMAQSHRSAWFEYVPSAANLSDPPSRGVAHPALETLQAVRTPAKFPPAHAHFFHPIGDGATSAAGASGSPC